MRPNNVYTAASVAIYMLASGTNARGVSHRGMSKRQLVPPAIDPRILRDPDGYSGPFPILPYPFGFPLEIPYIDPFEDMSGNVQEALETINQLNLAGFCNDVIPNEGPGKNQENKQPGDSTVQESKNHQISERLQKRNGRSYSSSYSNSNGNVVSSVSSGSQNSPLCCHQESRNHQISERLQKRNGRSYSSSYSNSNGNVVSSVNSGSQNSYTSTSNPGNPNSSSSYSYSSSNGEKHYFINGVRVPKALESYKPRTIEAACSNIVKNQQSQAGKGEPSPSPTPEQPSAPLLQPSPLPARFRMVYRGYGTDLPIHPSLQPGLPPVPYVHGAFSAYRRACADLCAATDDCGGFTINTNYRVNHCNLMLGRGVSRADFIDESAGGDEDDMFWVEGYRKEGSPGQEG